MLNHDEHFEREVAAIRDSGILGSKGKLATLFDYLAAHSKGASKGEESPNENVLAAEVFGKKDFSSSGENASVRVYVHRLRKKLEDYYSQHRPQQGYRLNLPRGEYRLILETIDNPAPAGCRWPVVAVLIALLAVNGLAWYFLAGSSSLDDRTPANALWAQLSHSSRPITILVGDYYLFSEDGSANETQRLVRDFRVDSDTDLEKLKMTDPAEFGSASDVGLNYLPVSVAYALKDITPLIKQSGRPYSLLPISAADAEILKNSDVIYVGFLSGLGFLDAIVFTRSHYAIGTSYDEVIDIDSNTTYRSTEMQGLSEKDIYNDYGYFSLLKTEENRLLMVIAGTRDTGLRGLSELLSNKPLPDAFSHLREKSRFEALFEIRGQQQANIREQLISSTP